MGKRKNQRSVVSFGGSRSEQHGVCSDDGGLAQLGERLPCKQEVSGSIPLISTTQKTRNPKTKSKRALILRGRINGARGALAEAEATKAQFILTRANSSAG